MKAKTTQQQALLTSTLRRFLKLIDNLKKKILVKKSKFLHLTGGGAITEKGFKNAVF